MIKDPEKLTGVVLNGAHGIYDVHTDIGVLRCTLRGKLKKSFAQAQAPKLVGRAKLPKERSLAVGERQNGDVKGAPSRLTVGDYVKLRRLDERTGLIEEILPRQSALQRRVANVDAGRASAQTMLANLDQVVIVLATTQPEPHFGMLDRYLAICESAAVYPIICLNKVDLAHDQQIEAEAGLYSSLGYTVNWTSSKTGEGIEALRSLLKERTTLLTGPSGVGKSSLVNAIELGIGIKTGLVSDATGKGRHTTTHSQLYPLSGGGWLADSAGIRALAAWNILPEELGWCFVEFRPYLGECGYADCLHVNEDDCAIRQALNDKVINERRYASYVRMVTNAER